MQKPKNILLTGPPGSGKTSIIREVLQHLSAVAGGFLTGEIREGGVRQGFKVESLDGREGVLAHVRIRGPRRVGKYGVDVEAFERIGVESLRKAARRGGTIVIDEIGRMELFSERFRGELLRALDSNNAVLATIQDRKDPLLDAIRGRRDTVVLRVTSETRPELVRRIVEMVQAV